MPTLTGKGLQQQHEYLYWEFHEKKGRIAVRKGNWKGVKYNVKTDPDSPLELYDLSKDIEEQVNVAEDYLEIVKEMEVIFKKARTESEHFRF
jgi:arylsulfatase A-like enzyme